MTLRAEFAALWAGLLTRQDEQPLRPHVTVCNKVTPERARAVERELTTRFTPRTFSLPGLALYAYARRPLDSAEHVPIPRTFDARRDQDEYDVRRL